VDVISDFLIYLPLILNEGDRGLPHVRIEIWGRKRRGGLILFGAWSVATA
jgi:hypothetical protein